MAFDVEIEISGLVDLVSDRTTAEPGQGRLLMPNAQVPDAGWITPEFLRFKKPHTARLLIPTGGRVSGVPLADPVLARCGKPHKGISLMGKHVTIVEELTVEAGPGGLCVDRGTTGDPNDPADSRTTVNYVNDLDRLVAEAGNVMGGIDPVLKDSFSADVATRLAARVLLSSGHLDVASIWRSDPTKGYKKIAYQRQPPPAPIGAGTPLPDVFMAHTMRLSGKVTGSTLTFELNALESGDGAGHLTLQPYDGVVVIIIENAPQDCEGHDNHFLGHYWLRENRAAATAAFYPSGSGWVMGAGMNPQCSPGENNG